MLLPFNVKAFNGGRVVCVEISVLHVVRDLDLRSLVDLHMCEQTHRKMGPKHTLLAQNFEVGVNKGRARFDRHAAFGVF